MPKLFLILVILNSPQTWTIIKDDSPFDPIFAELAPAHILLPPYSSPWTGHVCTSLARLAWSKVPSRTWQFRLDPSRPIIGCSQTGSTCVLDTLVSQLRTGALTSRAWILATDTSVACNFSHLSNHSRNMTCKFGYCVVLLMKPSTCPNGPEPEEYRNSSNDIMDKVELNLIQLHGMDSSEVASVKEVLMRASQRFQDLTGRSRRFILSFKRQVSAPNHLALDSGSGLIHLFKWIIQDKLEMSNLDYLPLCELQKRVDRPKPVGVLNLSGWS